MPVDVLQQPLARLPGTDSSRRSNTTAHSARHRWLAGNISSPSLRMSAMPSGFCMFW